MTEAEAGVLCFEDGGEMPVASRSRKRKGRRFSPETSRRNTALLTPGFHCAPELSHSVCGNLLEQPQGTNPLSFLASVTGQLRGRNERGTRHSCWAERALSRRKPWLVHPAHSRAPQGAAIITATCSENSLCSGAALPFGRLCAVKSRNNCLF